MVPATSDIRAVEFTASRDGDSPVLPDLPGQLPADEPIGTVIADGARDTRRCHSASIASDAVPIIPTCGNGRPCKEDCAAALAVASRARTVAVVARTDGATKDDRSPAHS